MSLIKNQDVLRRYERVEAMRADGKTFREIGSLLGISRQRAQQMIVKLERHRAHVARSARSLVRMMGEERRE